MSSAARALTRSRLCGAAPRRRRRRPAPLSLPPRRRTAGQAWALARVIVLAWAPPPWCRHGAGCLRGRTLLRPRHLLCRPSPATFAGRSGARGVTGETMCRRCYPARPCQGLWEAGGTPWWPRWLKHGRMTAPPWMMAGRWWETLVVSRGEMMRLRGTSVPVSGARTCGRGSQNRRRKSQGRRWVGPSLSPAGHGIVDGRMCARA